MRELLAAEGLVAGYGDSVVLEDVSFDLASGGSLALLGRNGVGKSTLLLTLMGLTRLRSGRIAFDGEEITQQPTHRRAHTGMGWVPQERLMFASLSVEEHLTVVARRGSWNLTRVYKLFPRLEERRRNLGNQLSGGEQQMLAIGRALMTRPTLLCMDEPSMGLAPRLVEEVFDIIQAINEQGTTIFVIEQNVNMALSIAHRGYVLQMGEVVLSGAAAELLENPLIQKAYLGSG